VVIPRKGRPGKARQANEHRRAFRRTVKWRTGSQARIGTLKRQYGWGPHPPRRPPRSPNLDRTRRPRPQPGQDRSAGSMINRTTEINTPPRAHHPSLIPLPRTSSGRSS
jgi:IS5 family transposase